MSVETPGFVVTLPVLCRALNVKSEEVRRTGYLIVDNTCKLVEDPAVILPLMCRLEPMVKSATEVIADPEMHGIAEKDRTLGAKDTLAIL